MIHSTCKHNANKTEDSQPLKSEFCGNLPCM